jgi:hypothetical protein
MGATTLAAGAAYKTCGAGCESQLHPSLESDVQNWQPVRCADIQKGLSIMILHNEVAAQIELQEAISNRNAVSEALQIEEVVNRAREIHRAHGGLIGYDLEDWVQAEHELVERNRPENFQVEETAQGEPFPRQQERNSQK